MKHTVLALVFSLLAPLALRAQSPYLVKDINSSTNASPASSLPSGFFRYGSRIYFAATTGSSGNELWSTDGTGAGTVQVADINVGTSSSNPARFAVVNGTLLFNARDSRGEELWTTDGTSAGTRLLADINPGSPSSSPGDRIVYHGKMIFAADDGVDGRELWITDGTPAGTRFFKDLVLGPSGSNPRSFVLCNDLVYFVTDNGLWKTDGTDAGTAQVKPSVPVTVGDLIVAGSRMFFTGYTSQTGGEPWVSDGTDAGTHMITDITPGSTTSVSFGNTAFGDRLLFLAAEPQHGAQLWISDGTAAGTHIVRTLDPGPNRSTNISGITVIGSAAFFSACTTAEGQELWRTDGTEAGTTLVRDIFPGGDGSFPTGLTAAGDKLFFIATSGGDRTLWSSDGTAAGTHQVKTTGRLAIATSSALFANLDGIVYFAGANALNGYEPWKSDGTDAGTSMIANLASDFAPSSDPTKLTAAGDWIYFEAWDGLGTVTSGGGQPRALWRSDGTPEGTLKLTDGPFGEITAVGSSIFFSKAGPTLWTSDGTPEGTVTASSFPSLAGGASIALVMGDKIFVNAGTLGSTTAAPNAPIVPLGVGSAYGFVEIAGRAMFFSGNGLWASDGTPAGTYAVVQDLGAVTSFGAAAGGYLYFVTSGTPGTTKLWKSDGTFEGTIVVKVLPLQPGVVAGFVAAGRNLFFTGSGQLWVTDGTDVGTRALPATPTGKLAAVGDRIVFPAADSANGTELWVSDGTSDGTHLLRDVYPGTISSSPFELTTVDGVVFFAAFDNVYGSETWVTDGTVDGTRLAADVEPGFGGSAPRQFVRSGNHLFFTAATLATGNELWALPLSSTPRLTINDIRVAEGDSGTTTARFAVTLSGASAQTVTVAYATADETALAGSDYDAASGTLTFAPGETSKSIDVRVHGDTVPGNNRAFLVSLRNAAGATLAKASGFAIIEDDDQLADLALALDFSLFAFDIGVNAVNNGPRTVTNMKIRHTVTPADPTAYTCRTTCQGGPQLLAPGATAPVFDFAWSGYQQYLTTTATIHQRDPQPSNNSVGWMINTFMAMDAVFLTPGSQGNVWFDFGDKLANVTVVSSDPAVISVPSTPTAAHGTSLTFIARALSVGKATIRVFTSTLAIGSITVDVVAPGTRPRWPGGVNAAPSNGATPFDQQMGFSFETVATAPYSGETATGLVTLTENGRELGRLTLTPGVGTQNLPVYLQALGVNSIRMDYAGDANFLPITATWSITATPGNVTILAGAERNGTTAIVHVRVIGSPQAAPTGLIRVSEPGVIPNSYVTLIAVEPGVAQADVILSNVSSGPHTLLFSYSGDSLYNAGTQSARLTEPRDRAVRH